MAVGGKIYKTENKDEASILKEVQNNIDLGYIHSKGNFVELDEQLVLHFEKFIEYLLYKNIELIFFLPSYHPILWNLIETKAKYKNIVNAESYFIKFARRKKNLK